MKKLLAEMDEKLGELEVAYNTMQYKNEKALKEKEARIAELETSRDEWQSRWMAAEKSSGESLGEKIGERELHTLEVDELTKRIAELEAEFEHYQDQFHE